ncbi:MAG: response regulator [Nitrospirae bacterium]|nr:response regulator [Nitrospirota bacterium]
MEFSSKKFSIEGKSLRNKLTVISGLMFVLPFLIFSYIIFKERILFEFEYPHFIIFGLILTLAIMGLIILRKIFDGFFTVAVSMRNEDIDNLYTIEVQNHTAELADISISFNKLIEKLEDTTKRLQEQTTELGREISERKKTEDMLSQAKQEWDNTFNTITDMITIHDKDFNIIRANKAAEKILDLPFMERASNIKCFKYFHGTEMPPEGCPSCESIKSGSPIAFERFEPKLNMFVEIRAMPRFDSDNRLTGLIHIVRDISDRKKTEERLRESETQLRHAQKMEAVGQFAGGIAHDFNNILTAIIGYTTFLQMKLKGDDPLRRNVEQILTASNRASNLTRSFLAFGRKQIINLKPIDLNEIIKKVDEFLSHLIGEDIEVKTTITEGELSVIADIGQIEQVLVNLAANAREAMPDGGVLTVGTGSMELDGEFVTANGYGEPGRYAVISVADTGIGMDDKTMERIFEPFFTTKETGTGLGLSIAYGIIKQHNGYINCHSEPGKGATFRIYLPITLAAPEGEGKHEDIAIPAGGSETLLIAEDDEDVRKLTKEVLGEFGYSVIEAADGYEAINRFIENEDKIALLLLDVIMPKKGGREVYEEIRKIRPEIKVIFSSGYASDFVHKKEILEQGLNFMAKPIPPMEILKKVREVLDGR